MKLHSLDIAIIGVYFVTTVLIGLWVSRRGAKDLNSYFLGGKSLPWYLLGISDASGMFDISGTMLMVYWLLVYGMKSIWLPFLWPVFNQIFLMMFLSGWLRRSNVLTGAEWIQTRFGRGTRRQPRPPQRGDLRPHQGHRHARLRLQGHRQIRRGDAALAYSPAPPKACSPTRTSTPSSSSC